MLNFVPQSNKFDTLRTFVKKGYSFTASGLNAFFKMLLLEQILKTKKVVFITATEQSALRYKNDIEKLTGIESVIFPYQDISMYDEVQPNQYKYFEQINIISSLRGDNVDKTIQPDIVRSQSLAHDTKNDTDSLDCFVAGAPRNDAELIVLLPISFKSAYSSKF